MTGQFDNVEQIKGDGEGSGKDVVSFIDKLRAQTASILSLSDKIVDAHSRSAQLAFFHSPFLVIFFPILKGGCLLVSSMLNIREQYKQEKISSRTGPDKYRETFYACISALVYALGFVACIMIGALIASPFVSGSLTIAVTLGMVVYDFAFELRDRRRQNEAFRQLQEELRGFDSEIEEYSAIIASIDSKLGLDHLSPFCSRLTRI